MYLDIGNGLSSACKALIQLSIVFWNLPIQNTMVLFTASVQLQGFLGYLPYCLFQVVYMQRSFTNCSILFMAYAYPIYG